MTSKGLGEGQAEPILSFRGRTCYSSKALQPNSYSQEGATITMPDAVTIHQASQEGRIEYSRELCHCYGKASEERRKHVRGVQYY